MDGGDGEFVLVDGSNWKFVFVDGRDGQVVALGCETGLIGNPGQSEFLALGGDPVGRSLVGVAVNILVFVSGVVLAVRILGVNDLGANLLLDLRLLTGGVVRSGVAVSPKCIIEDYACHFTTLKMKSKRQVTSIGCCHRDCGHRTGSRL